ncbi:NAD(P)-dependent dehydrogenase (short-subunit alcohol dehydrogenase family) [Paenibacillus taihuensis]|uniref:NAD(P)-dependent dehydrogenase (Short-subunit alcohol dehydrogenase family) n=1 Tax=Paenibacillus taihuensis TaxID=1156355 RepID=A0A3D9S733_9BACL|nr:SDR family oxidoreductase [Paenibacillus taihuensis]REE88976.1 NAD(P)-dependent dehydrogenase (short-subunit alcohol dehydrogenase family) [Paenibacillus taihuensis]
MGERLIGKTIVVTGAMKGIGRGISLKCAAEGANVVVADLSEQEGDASVIRQIEQMGTAGKSLFIQTDITKTEDCRQLIQKTVEIFGRIDGLVNNAAIYPRGNLLNTSEELFDTVFDVNIKGAFYCSQYAVASMIETGGGSIVHIGSTNAYMGQMDLAAYACSKGAMLTLSKHIAHNYAAKQVRSNWITVGWVASDGEIELHRKLGVSPEQLAAMGEATVPNGRLQTAEDIAYGAVFLLSDESASVTGTELAITGGHRMR